MAREPAFPKDVPVGEPEADDEAPAAKGSTRTKALVTGAAIGIGSAALVAALLYANRSRRGGRKP